MIKIVGSDVIDMIPFSSGIIYVKKSELDNGSIKLTFYGYDIKRMENTPVTKSVYLLNKFGSSYGIIAEKLGDYASCDAGILPNKFVVIIYPSGEMGLFDEKANLVWSNDLLYKGHAVQGLAIDESNIWCTVPELNAIISYSIPNKKFVMRIGGDSSTAFSKPISIVKYNNELLICNEDSFKIRTISLDDYSVNDFRLFDEPVYKYLRVCGKEVVLLESGIYVL